jgi:RNA polymerase sigma-70 factor, ECF subfamily
LREEEVTVILFGRKKQDPLDQAAQEVMQGNVAAFRIIVQALSAKLVRLGARMLGNASDAEDLVQEAFLKAHAALTSGNFDGRASVSTWMHRIVCNLAIDQLRAGKRQGRTVSVTDEMLVDSHLSSETQLALRELSEWLSALPPEQRVALVLSTVEGHSNAEIASMLECSEGAVEQRLVRARTLLRERRSLEQ